MGQKYVSARKNMRNELFSNYQKLKKKQDVKISNFENLNIFEMSQKFRDVFKARGSIQGELGGEYFPPVWYR